MPRAIATARDTLLLLPCLLIGGCYSPTMRAPAAANDGSSESGSTVAADTASDDAADDDTRGEGDTSGGDADPSLPTSTSSGEFDGGGSSTAGDSSTGTDAEGSDSSGGNDNVVVLPGDMIDDFEDGDGMQIESDGRVGRWFGYDDASGGTCVPAGGDMLVPSAGGPAGSTLSATTSGSGFTLWGAGIAVDLHHPMRDVMPSPYDASGFEGIVFWARGDTDVRVLLVTSATSIPMYGGTCELVCNDSYATVVSPDATWRRYVVPFDTLAQGGWGTPVEFDSSTLMGVSFQLPANTTFELSIDELGFYRAQ